MLFEPGGQCSVLISNPLERYKTFGNNFDRIDDELKDMGIDTSYVDTDDYIREFKRAQDELYDKTLKYDINSEEATKQWMILPLFQKLNYNIFSDAVIPEYTADVGTKSGEKLDYLLTKVNNHKILVECKSAKLELNNKHVNQLFRYYSALKSCNTQIDLAVLTNGIEYQLFKDTDMQNIMDLKPYFVHKMEDKNNEQVQKFISLLDFNATTRYGDIRDDRRFCKLSESCDLTTEIMANIIAREYNYYTKKDKNLLINERQALKKLYDWYKSEWNIYYDEHRMFSRKLKYTALLCDLKIEGIQV